MELLALLSSRDDSVIPDVKAALGRYTVFPLKTIEELEDLYGSTPLSLILIDTSSYSLHILQNFLERIGNDMVVLITSGTTDRFPKSCIPVNVFDSVGAGAIRTDLPPIVERALERNKFKDGSGLSRKSRDVFRPLQAGAHKRTDAEMFSPRYDPAPGGRFAYEKVVVNFAKMLTANFDIQKLFNHFIDSVMEIARVSRMSVLLKDKDIFRVRTHYGLDPHLAENLQLRKDGPLAAWLARTGCIMNKPVNPYDPGSGQIGEEMEILQCSVSFPMMHKGKLIGIFNIDNKVTEEPFYREEVEIIYMLCNYLAAAVKDIDVYHHMWYQNEFTSNIISSMSSGMIAVDSHDKITVFNQQAADILNLRSSEMLGNDLRILPPPLGDILLETMKTGNSYRRHEVTIVPSGLSLGINSYRLLNEKQEPAGAGIIFTDLSDTKKLEEQRAAAEKLSAVHDLMSKIAHEIRNPLTSIQTYTQLLNNKLADDELQRFYISIVSQSISRLDSLIDKIITFSSTQHYNLSMENINDLMIEAENYILRDLPETHKVVRNPAGKLFYINADKKQLVKAVYYIVQSIVDRTPDGTTIILDARPAIRDGLSVEISISYEGDKAVQKGEQYPVKPLIDIKDLGTELNMPICHKIVERHNGTIEMKSCDGDNIFIISLPAFHEKRSEVPLQGGYFGEQ